MDDIVEKRKVLQKLFDDEVKIFPEALTLGEKVGYDTSILQSTHERMVALRIAFASESISSNNQDFEMLWDLALIEGNKIQREHKKIETACMGRLTADAKLQ